MGTKANPGKYDCYTKAEDDEPMFVLLARDPAAPTLVRMWAELRELMDLGHVGKHREAIEIAECMARWAERHPDHGPLKP